DAATGALHWEHDLLEGNDNLQWGQCGSPLIVGELVVVTPGAQSDAAKGRAVQAFDRKTGKPVWARGDREGGYSSPQLSTLSGMEQILLLDGKAVAGYDPKTGRELWSHPWETYQDIKVAQPLVIGDDRVFISVGYDHGCQMLRVTKTGDTWNVA